MNKQIFAGIFCVSILTAPAQALFGPLTKMKNNIEGEFSDAVYKGAIDGAVRRFHDFALDSGKEDKVAVLLAAVQLFGFDLAEIEKAQDKGFDIISQNIAETLKEAGYGQEDNAVTKVVKTAASMYLSAGQWDRVAKVYELKHDLAKKRKYLKKEEEKLSAMWKLSKNVTRRSKKKELVGTIKDLKKDIKKIEKKIKGQDNPGERLLMQVISKL